MSAVELDLPHRRSWRQGTGVHQRLLALATVLGAALAMGCIWLAAGGFEPVLAIVVAPMVLWCALTPDSELGLLLLLVLGVLWLGTVDVDARTGPWLLGAALGILVVHTSMAAGTAAPPGARWTAALVSRWTRRTGVVAATTTVVWGVAAAAVELRDPDGRGSGPLLVVALGALALAGWWIRSRTLPDGDGRPR